MIEQLRAFAETAYIGNPMPAPLKERLFVHLSRFCEERCCLARHCALLIGLEDNAAEGGSRSHRLEQLVRLLRRPAPSAHEVETACAVLGAAGSLPGWPEAGTPVEDAVIVAATPLFLEPGRAGQARRALHGALGERRHEQLLDLLGYIRATHFWAVTHPGIGPDEDARKLLRQHEELAALLQAGTELVEGSAPWERQSRKLQPPPEPHDGAGQERATPRLALGDGELETSATLFQAVLDSSTDYAIMVTDRNSLVTIWNEGARRIFGWAEADMRGQTAIRIFTPEDIGAGVPEAEMQTALREGRAEDDRWHLRKDGTRLWVNGAMMPLRTVSGEHLGFLKILRDRTDQRRVATALQVSEDRLQLALSASSLIGIWDWDTARDLVVADAHFAGFYGVDPERAAAGVPVAEYTAAVHPADRRRLAEAIRRALAMASEFAEEYRLIQRDGTIRWVFSRGRVYLDEAGKPTRLPGVAVDITDRKMAEERQRLLVELGDRVRDLKDTAAIAGTAAEILGRALNVARAGYLRVEDDRTGVVETDWTNGLVASIEGQHHLSDFGDLLANLKKGGIVAVADVATDPRTESGAASFAALGVCGLLNVPLIENGRLAALLYLHDSRPRHWKADEIAFVREVAERTWAYAERARAEAHQRLLAVELQHRVKNTLAMVQAIVNQSLRSAASLGSAGKTINDRLKVLALAHDTLMGPGHASAPIAEVVAGAVHVGAGESGRVRLAGPQLVLGAKPALALSMALHELCTNAVKYGALSNDTGHVEVSWLVAEHPTRALFQLRWSEHGGPRVDKPTRRGFGSRLIEAGIAADLSGEAKLEFDARGVTWSLSAPLSAIQP